MSQSMTFRNPLALFTATVLASAVSACAGADRRADAPVSTTAKALDTHDVMTVAPEHYKVRVDNAYVRVVENVLGPGEKDGMHTHPAGWYYVTLPGTMKIGHPDGTTKTWEAKAGEAGWMEAEGLHTSENAGTQPMGFILVEVKSARQ
jgi:hypothetical protein